MKSIRKTSDFFCLFASLLLCIPAVYAQDEAIDTEIDSALLEQGAAAVDALVNEAGETLEDNSDAVEAAVDASLPEAMESADTLLDNTPPPVILLDEAADNPDQIQKDMVLVLDNSGSMKKNDPDFLTSEAVTAFIEELDASTRLSIIIFDQNVQLAEPFQQVTPENRIALLSSLESIDYKGLYTDSPAAIERAIYELKNNSREDAKKLIVFMTDGIVDTGNAEMDVEKAKWLKQDLAADAAENEIVIFGIAFTEAADFQLIQSLAQQTEGEYYRALAAEDLRNVFNKINTIIHEPPEPEPVEVVEPPVPEPTPEPVVMPEPAPPPPPVIIEVPVQAEDETAGLKSTMLIAAVAVISLALIAILFLLIRRRGQGESEPKYVQQAFLNDIHGHTHQSRYELGARATMLGRVDSKENDHLNHIVIPQSTIGRRHALIEYKDYAFWIIDQGSINGTFVNDKQIDGETRLKHGDRVRLHKFEFEFNVPELEEDGMTQISNTVFAGAAAVAAPVVDESEDVTIARGGTSSADELPEPDFNLELDDDTSGGIEIPDFSDAAETGPQSVSEDFLGDKPDTSDLDLDITGMGDEVDSEDETFINPNSYDDGEGSEETIILHDDFDDDSGSDQDSEATIRRSTDDDERFKETDIYPTSDK